MDDETVGVAETDEAAEIASEPQDSASLTEESDGTADAADYGGEDAEQEAVDYFSAFRGLPDFNGMQDRDIAGRLYQALQREKTASEALSRYQRIIPYAQDFLANKPEFLAWKKAQQAASAPAPQPKAEEKSWWSPPQVREAYKQYLVKDEHGRDVISPDAPLDARHELYEYQQYKADFAKRFLENPEQALGPMIEKMAQQQAAQIVERQFSEISQKGYVANVEAENADWLFDENGNVSPEGVAAQTYIDEAKQLGIASPEARWAYSTAMVERDLLRRVSERMQQAPAMPPQQSVAPTPQQRPAPTQAAVSPAQAQTQKNMDFLRKEASRNPSRSSTSVGSSSSSQPQRRSFEQMLRDQAAADGLM